MILFFLLGLAVGAYVACLFFMRGRRDEGLRPADAILKQQERIFSDQSGGHSVFRNTGDAVYDQENALPYNSGPPWRA